MQAETETRKRKIAEVRQEDADARHRLQERKLELKVASEARLAASHAAKEAAALARAADAAAKTHRQALAASAKEASAAAQKAEEEAKAAKDKEKKTHAETLARRAKRRLTCAGALAEALRKQIQDKDSGESRKAALLTFTNTRKGKVPWKNMAKLPEILDHRDKSGLRCLSIKDNGKKYTEKIVVFASEKFAWEMWGHRKPTGPSQTQLGRFVNQVMPGYSDTIGVRWSIPELLEEFKGNADVAFLAAAWYYSSLVPASCLPVGLRQWPPPTTYVSPAASSSTTPG